MICRGRFIGALLSSPRFATIEPVATPLTAERFLGFLHQDRETIRRDFDPYLFRYYQKLFTDPREAAGFLRWINKLTRHCDPSGGVLLDAGCGFGITSLAFLAGDRPPRQVVAVDPSAGKIEVLQKIATSLDLSEEQLRPVLDDCMALQFEDNSFDVVFVKDVASHVADRAAFFREMARVLKSGGRLLFTDENNSLSVPGRRERARIWKSAEEGPLPDDSWMKYPYLIERYNQITGWRPELDEAARRRLASNSKGMWGEELEAAIRAWQPGNVFKNTADFPYRSPVSGEYLEYLFNPFELCKELGAYGLDAKLIPPAYRSGSPVKQRVGDFIAALHPASIVLQSSFYLVARKR